MTTATRRALDAAYEYLAPVSLLAFSVGTMAAFTVLMLTGGAGRGSLLDGTSLAGSFALACVTVGMLAAFVVCTALALHGRRGQQR